MVQDTVTAVLVWFVGLLVGAVAISIGARLFVDRDTGLGRALFTAIVGAGAWALASFFFGGIPLVGPLLMLIVWVGVINIAYPGGWLTATGIGVAAWVVAVAVIALLGSLGVVTPDALGIPGI
jgi:hypothetical protein